jgi:hypothetical protein
MNRKIKKIAAFCPAVFVVPRYSACIAHSKMSVIVKPVKPVRRNVLRPSLSMKNAVKMLPGNEAVTHKADRSSGM